MKEKRKIEIAKKPAISIDMYFLILLFGVSTSGNNEENRLSVIDRKMLSFPVIKPFLRKKKTSGTKSIILKNTWIFQEGI
ncbi:MAG: hypothetical protein QXY45_02860 [Candidatus Aenigmatarchaeota archaeon]